jgi:SAM-dependent methyltransferase
MHVDPLERRPESDGRPRELPTAAEQGECSASAPFDFYGAHYGRFGTKLAAAVRREAYGEDLGQTGWRTATEQAAIADHLRLGPDSHVLDVACGAGGPSLELVHRTGCRLTGIDIEAAGIAQAKAQSLARGLADRSTFAVIDGSRRLPFENGTFDAVLCIDAISHLPDRFGTLSEWARLLRRGGRLLFTDSSILTGAVSRSEIDIRGGIGFFLFVPPGLDEQAIEAAGLILLRREDCTAATAEVAARLHDARARHAAALQREEGAEWFGQRQRLLATTAELARNRRLSRFLYVAEKAMQQLRTSGRSRPRPASRR